MFTEPEWLVKNVRYFLYGKTLKMFTAETLDETKKNKKKKYGKTREKHDHQRDVKI